jgi:hypothetical protein
MLSQQITLSRAPGYLWFRILFNVASSSSEVLRNIEKGGGRWLKMNLEGFGENLSWAG